MTRRLAARSLVLCLVASAVSSDGPAQLTSSATAADTAVPPDWLDFDESAAWRTEPQAAAVAEPGGAKAPVAVAQRKRRKRSSRGHFVFLDCFLILM